jgi:Spy/CpxP family protein refolding chaperone
MKPTRKFLALATGTVLLIGGLSAAAFAGDGHKGGGRFFHKGGGMLPGMRLMHLAERLDLTEEQEVAAVRMRRAIREEAKLNRAEMQGAFDEVIAELQKPEPNAAKLHQLVDEATARMTKVAHSSVDKYLEFHRTLTPEQRQTLVEQAKLAKERRKEFKKQRLQK